ncbi:excalibur calcium-binding domain-containing protein [Sphingomonas sp. dw_22]|uniref:excalibur calcium-binding domain-containing protein n=1 Tax=Sphingomonas sp. dw_22 TaxID=2721175 RepID=UPI001BD4DAB7|nr:excalibur calcium-binding domain-containing protein [Sphingomonas sp. dw_22]
MFFAAAGLLAAGTADAAADDPRGKKSRRAKSVRAPVSRPVRSADGAYYPNCAAARAAGAAPIRRGDPGYSGRLDRDGDGVACER